MRDDLLSSFQAELSYLQELGGEFAQAFPKVAGRLQLSKESVEDPHVSRLVESVAFLNARIRTALDDEFPELTNGLLETLYPHFLAPIPSMMVVQFQCDPEATAAPVFDRETVLETDPGRGEPCTYRPAWEGKSYPLSIGRTQLQGVPFRSPESPAARTSPAILHVTLERTNDQFRFPELSEGLRFYLNADSRTAAALYELLLNDVVEVLVASSVEDEEPTILPADSLQPGGFGDDEHILPMGGRSLPAFGWLTEFFAFPEKFHFVDLHGLPAEKLAALEDRLELYFVLRRRDADLEQTVQVGSLLLGCVPVVNLFRFHSDPQTLDRTRPEHEIVPDTRRRHAFEVYSVDRLWAVSSGGGRVDYLPIHGSLHPGQGHDETAYYQAVRRPAISRKERLDAGTNVFVTLMDLDREVLVPHGWSLEAELTCFNRNMPNRLPFGGGDPVLEVSGGAGQLVSVQALTRPTPTRRPELGDSMRWRLIAHLSLNHLPLGPRPGGDARDATAELQEILSVYDVFGTPQSRSLVDAVEELSCRVRTLRVRSAPRPGDGGSAVVRGTELVMRLHEGRMAGTGAFAFAVLLERFLAQYAAVNSFTQLVLHSSTREGEVKRWPARAGATALL